MIFVDTNVFVVALRYPRDRNAAENSRFLETVARRRRLGVRILGTLGGGPLSIASEEELLLYLERRLSFGDALVAHAVETLAPDAESFVTWDAPHFRGKLAPRALTPREFLREARAPAVAD